MTASDRAAEAANLVVDICSFWVTGTGAGRGYGIDRATARDADGLPYLPGRHIRGLLRDAVRRAVALGMPRRDGSRWPDDTEFVLFGSAGRTGPYPDFDGRRSAGLLETRDAQLPVKIREALRGADRSEARASLVRQLHQTAIHETLFVASNASLRTTEVVLPLRLIGEIALVPGAHAAAEEMAPGSARLAREWREALDDVFCLVDAVGAGRRHGLGRAVLSWEAA